MTPLAQLPAPPTPGDFNQGAARSGHVSAPHDLPAGEFCPWPSRDYWHAYERMLAATSGYRDAVEHFLVDLAAAGVTDIRRWADKTTLTKLRARIEAAEERRSEELDARPRARARRPSDGKPLDRVTVAYVA